jgi:hypothetical protein
METDDINECLTTQFTNPSRSPRIKVDQEGKNYLCRSNSKSTQLGLMASNSARPELGY